MSAYVTYPTVQVACPSGSDLSTAVNSCLSSLPSPTGGICDARACSANFTWNNATTISVPNSAVLLPCGTLTATATVTVSPTVRNVTIHGCAYQGGSAGSGTAGGSVWNYQGSATAFVIGDPSDGSDTPGFFLTDLVIATANGGSSAHAIDFHRVQEIDVERVYFVGNNSTGQTGITLDGTGNYSGGTFQGFRLSNFGTALNMTGDGTGAANASTFTRMHINCSTSGGSPITGVIGVNLAYGNGNTFVGGDIEGCDTMLSLGAGANSNTFVGVRNENSNSQVNAASGSQYNLWLTGGTMFTGKLTDAGTHNSFADTFHRSWNNLNGDLWRSQADATVVDHELDGIGLGNVRGHQHEYETDVPGMPNTFQNAWLWGPGDGATGVQVFELEDLINTLPRFGVSQNTTIGGNGQTFLNSLGTAGVCMNCSPGGGTGGFFVATGGATPSSVFNVASTGQTYQLGELDFYNGATETWQFECASLTSCNLRNANATTPMTPLSFATNGGTAIASQGTGAVTVNNAASSGTGGLGVYLGGADNGVLGFGVSGYNGSNANVTATVGSASGVGNLQLGNHLNQLATADFAGTCTMSTTTCHVGLQHSYTAAVCFASDQSTSGHAYANSAYYSAGDCYITSATSNTDTWGCVCIGNPN